MLGYVLYVRNVIISDNDNDIFWEILFNLFFFYGSLLMYNY